MDAVTMRMAQLPKRSAIAIDLEVAGSGPVSCCLSIPSLSLPCVVLYLVFHWHCHGA